MELIKVPITLVFHKRDNEILDALKLHPELHVMAAGLLTDGEKDGTAQMTLHLTSFHRPMTMDEIIQFSAMITDVEQWIMGMLHNAMKMQETQEKGHKH